MRSRTIGAWLALAPLVVASVVAVGLSPLHWSGEDDAPWLLVVPPTLIVIGVDRFNGNHVQHPR